LNISYPGNGTRFFHAELDFISSFTENCEVGDIINYQWQAMSISTDDATNEYSMYPSLDCHIQGKRCKFVFMFNYVTALLAILGSL
jgi:hypothetical protein